MNNQSSLSSRRRPPAVWGCRAAVILGLFAAAGRADDTAPRRSTAATEYAVVGAELGPSQLGRLRNTALSLQRLAAAAGDSSTRLVLEIQPGPATLEQTLELAEWLASSDVRDVQTIAWVPESLTGPRAVIALACREIVLHPDAQLGDLAGGGVVAPQLRTRIDQLAARRTNPRVSPAVVTAMLDPQASLVRVTTAADGEPARLVLADELALLKSAGVEVRDVRILKPAGSVGVFSGAQGAADGFLVTHTAHDRAELARHYQLDADELSDRPVVQQVERPALIKVEGEITPLLTAFLQRQIERAVARRADVIIFEIDSPGGLLQDSLDLAFQIADLRDQGIRTVAYVPRDAVSGAALISLGCDEIYLHASGKIGDAGPIELRADGNVHRAPEKIVSYLREVVRELAELKGRPPAILMAMVDRELDVYQVTQRDTGKVWYLAQSDIDAASGEWTRGPLVAEAANELLLFVNGRRAHELLVAEPPVESLTELRTRLGVPTNVRLNAVEQTWLDDAVFILNTNVVTGLLFFLGIILLFIELHFMLGLFGILSALCFGVFFWSKFLGGTAGWLEVLLFLLGFACVAIEIFVIPGFGVFGLAGGMLVLASLLMAGTSLSDLDEGVAVSQTLSTAWTLGLAVAGVVGAGMGLSHFLPRIPLLNSMILAPPSPAEVAPASGAGRRGSSSVLVGQRGVAVTMLRPSGKVRIGDQLSDAVTAGGFIAPGDAVEVADVVSNRLVVRPATESVVEGA